MRIALVSACLLLSGCAGVSFKQLTPTLAASTSAPEGAVYYLPKPYLLVAQLPVASKAPGPANQAPDPSPPPAGGTARDRYPSTYAPRIVGGGEDEKKKDDAAEAAPPASSGTDQSFAAQSDGYMIKLIYLPDMTRPMAMSMQGGFGTASLKPTLQNGWMLTGFDASADSNTAEILGSVASLVTAFKTPGAAAAEGGDEGKGGAAGGPERSILKPGLYEFRFDTQGKLTGLCPVSLVSATGDLEQKKAC